MESQWQSTTNESHVRCSEYILRINNTLYVVGIRAFFFIPRKQSLLFHALVSRRFPGRIKFLSTKEDDILHDFSLPDDSIKCLNTVGKFRRQ